jgi:ABC-type spermidine/putrescine transport system permease subunit II
MAYLKNILISIDQFINTLLNGNPDETLSSRAFKLRKKGTYWASNIINGIFFWQQNHCKESKEKD